MGKIVLTTNASITGRVKTYQKNVTCEVELVKGHHTHIHTTHIPQPMAPVSCEQICQMGASCSRQWPFCSEWTGRRYPASYLGEQKANQMDSPNKLLKDTHSFNIFLGPKSAKVHCPIVHLTTHRNTYPNNQCLFQWLPFTDSPMSGNHGCTHLCMGITSVVGSQASTSLCTLGSTNCSRIFSMIQPGRCGFQTSRRSTRGVQVRGDQVERTWRNFGIHTSHTSLS